MGEDVDHHPRRGSPSGTPFTAPPTHAGIPDFESLVLLQEPQSGNRKAPMRVE